MKTKKPITLALVFLSFVTALLLSNTNVKVKKLRHVVAFNYKSDVTEEQKHTVTNEFYELKKHIKEIVEFEGGEDINTRSGNKKFTHCYIVTVKNEKELAVYGNHPMHKAFSAMVDPMLAEVMVVDYWAE